MLGKRSTGSRVSDTHPRASDMSDIMRMKMGLRSASRVSHMASRSLPYFATAAGAADLPE